MGKLENVIASMNKQQQRAVEDMNSNMSNATQSLILKLLQDQQQPPVTAARFEDVCRQLAGGIKQVGQEVSRSAAKVSKDVSGINLDLKPVLDKVARLESHVNSLVAALNGIELPKPDAPVVNVDAPDLSSLQDAIDSLRTDISNIQVHVQGGQLPAPVETKPREFRFTMKRSQGGRRS